MVYNTIMSLTDLIVNDSLSKINMSFIEITGHIALCDPMKKTIFSNQNEQ